MPEVYAQHPRSCWATLRNHIPFIGFLLLVAPNLLAQEPGLQVAPALVADLEDDPDTTPCGSIPSRPIQTGDHVYFQALPFRDDVVRIFRTDGTTAGTVRALPTLSDNQTLLGLAASGRVYARVDQDVVTFSADGGPIETLFSPPFVGNLVTTIQDRELFQQINPPSFWWSDGTAEGLTYSGAGVAEGRVALIETSEVGAIVAHGAAGAGAWTLSLIRPGQEPIGLGAASSWRAADRPVEFDGFDLQRRLGEENTLIEISASSEGGFDVTQSDLPCTELKGFGRVTDRQIIFSGVCPGNESLAVFLFENGSITHLLDAYVDPPTPIPIPLPSSPPVIFREAGERLIISVYTPDGYVTHTWNEVERSLEPTTLLDLERLVPFYEHRHIRLFSGTLDGESTIWSLQPDGSLQSILPGPVLGHRLRTEPTGVGDEIAFYYDDGVHGTELWATDGTREGTRLVYDLEPGDNEILQTSCRFKGDASFGSFPLLRPTVLGDKLLYSGYRADVGFELFSLPVDLFESEDSPEPPPACQDTNTLCLRDGDFQVRTTWATQNADGVGTPVDGATLDTGLFWFFQPSNWELMVKVLDGCATNGHYWVLAGGTTDVAYRLEVEQTEGGALWSRDNPLGQRSPSIIDIEAFPCEP